MRIQKNRRERDSITITGLPAQYLAAAILLVVAYFLK
jgi:hypothetical protein